MNACRSCNIVITETDIVSFSAFIQTDNELRYMVDGHIDGVPHVSIRFVSRFEPVYKAAKLKNLKF